MSLATETVSPAIMEMDRWVLITARTNLDLKRPRPKPVPSSWTAYSQQEAQLENSTAQQEVPKDLDQRMIALFEAAKEQNFEDGMEGEFS